MKIEWFGQRASGSVDAPPTARPRGRPSDESIDRGLLEAGLAEFTERGYHAMSMESIAARAGVSKVSLYRRWSSKPDIVAELFRFLGEQAPAEDRGNFEAELRALIAESIGSGDAAARGKLVLRTMGEISGNPELLALYRELLLEPRLEQLRAIVRRARTRGELRPDLPIDAACALIAGPLFMYYLTLLAETEIELSADPVEALVRAILGGLAGSAKK